MHRLRLLRVALYGSLRKKVFHTDPIISRFRVAPSDVDVTRMFTHSYLSLMALGRWDYIIRTGIAPRLVRGRWIPLTLAENIQYRRSLRLFQKFTLSTRLIHIEGKAFYFEHSFEAGGTQMALGYSKGLLKSPAGVMSAEEVLGVTELPRMPPPTESLRRWIESLASAG